VQFSVLFSGFFIFSPSFPVTLPPNAGHWLFILEVSKSHTATHHRRWTSDQLVAETPT